MTFSRTITASLFCTALVIAAVRVHVSDGELTGQTQRTWRQWCYDNCTSQQFCFRARGSNSYACYDDRFVFCGNGRNDPAYFDPRSLGKEAPSEQCDDGGRGTGDGCNDTCRLENHWQVSSCLCGALPSQESTVCSGHFICANTGYGRSPPRTQFEWICGNRVPEDNGGSGYPYNLTGACTNELEGTVWANRYCGSCRLNCPVGTACHTNVYTGAQACHPEGYNDRTGNPVTDQNRLRWLQCEDINTGGTGGSNGGSTGGQTGGSSGGQTGGQQGGQTGGNQGGQQGGQTGGNQGGTGGNPCAGPNPPPQCRVPQGFCEVPGGAAACARGGGRCVRDRAYGTVCVLKECKGEVDCQRTAQGINGAGRCKNYDRPPQTPGVSGTQCIAYRYNGGVQGGSQGGVQGGTQGGLGGVLGGTGGGKKGFDCVKGRCIPGNKYPSLGVCSEFCQREEIQFRGYFCNRATAQCQRGGDLTEEQCNRNCLNDREDGGQGGQIGGQQGGTQGGQQGGSQGGSGGEDIRYACVRNLRCMACGFPDCGDGPLFRSEAACEETCPQRDTGGQQGGWIGGESGGQQGGQQGGSQGGNSDSGGGQGFRCERGRCVIGGDMTAGQCEAVCMGEGNAGTNGGNQGTQGGQEGGQEGGQQGGNQGGDQGDEGDGGDTGGPRVERCRPLDNNNSETADTLNVVFVGYNFSSVDNVLPDARAYRDDLLSYEPYKGNANRIQFWLGEHVEPIGVSDNGRCHLSCPASRDMRNVCQGLPNRVLAVVCNRNCRSAAYFNGISYNSTHDNRTGLFTHEFSHQFGLLADEYFEPGLGDWPRSPNCAPASSDVTSAAADEPYGLWNSLRSNPTVGIFRGCSYDDTNVRPTSDSLMKTLRSGANFLGPVNIAWVRQRLAAYSPRPSSSFRAKLASMFWSPEPEVQGEHGLELTLKRQSDGSYAVQSAIPIEVDYPIKPTFEQGFAVKLNAGGYHFSQTFADEEMVISERVHSHGGLALHGMQRTPKSTVVLRIGTGDIRIQNITEPPPTHALGAQAITLDLGGTAILPNGTEVPVALTTTACSNIDDDPTNDCPAPAVRGEPLPDPLSIRLCGTRIAEEGEDCTASVEPQLHSSSGSVDKGISTILAAVIAVLGGIIVGVAVTVKR